MIPHDTPICCACLKPLTAEERHYYECRCEACEGAHDARLDRWRKGNPDAELEAMFSVPSTYCCQSRPNDN